MILANRNIPEWVMQGIGKHHEGMFGIGEIREGQLIAGIAFENKKAKSIWGHQKIEAPPSKAFWITAADYIFNHCKCERMSATVEADNAKAIRLNLHIGFVIEHVLKDAGDNGDLLIMTLWKDNCRFLKWVKK